MIPDRGVSAISPVKAAARVARLFGATAAIALWLVPPQADGAAWSTQASRAPSGARSSSLSAVSCPSRASCIAVGRFTNHAGRQLALVERWNGARWAVQTTPTLARADDSGLSGIACPSARACIAVGFVSSRTSESPLAERWNGRRWSIIPTAVRAHATSLLNAVSCRSTRDCAAVGNSSLAPREQATLAERWNGTRWTIERTPNTAQASDLTGVSCASSANCTAVGSTTNSTGNTGTLALRSSGARWNAQHVPNPGVANSGLSGVACPLTSLCIAVGFFINSTSQATLAEQWSGTRWVPTLSPMSGSAGNLDAISCASVRACTAVGTLAGAGGHDVTLAEHWDGATWSIQPTPSPIGRPESTLEGISCVSAGFCVAVGDSGNLAVGRSVMLIERYG